MLQFHYYAAAQHGILLSTKFGTLDCSSASHLIQLFKIQWGNIIMSEVDGKDMHLIASTYLDLFIRFVMQ